MKCPVFYGESSDKQPEVANDGVDKLYALSMGKPAMNINQGW